MLFVLHRKICSEPPEALLKFADEPITKSDTRNVKIYSLLKADISCPVLHGSSGESKKGHDVY